MQALGLCLETTDPRLIIVSIFDKHLQIIDDACLLSFKGRLSIKRQSPAMGQGGSNIRPQSPEVLKDVKEGVHLRFVLPAGAIQRKARLRCYVCFFAAVMEFRLGGKDIGALAIKLRRQSYRKHAGKLKVRRTDSWLSPFRVCVTDQAGKKVIGLSELLLQGREPASKEDY